jgi:crotonobetainyl-CoA:carnitine CoA-transferase CaiB-like acyl-CoA transferase
MGACAGGALDDVLVLDFSTMLPGQTCSMILADLGARIISVEHPNGGHYSRRFGLPASYESVNRNKQSITVDLKTPDGQAIVQRLAERADIVLEGFRPGVAARLGIDYEVLKRLNPRLIYCSISGYGQDGMYRDLPGHDPNYLSIAGVLSLAGDPAGPPSADVAVSMADLAAAWFATIAVLAALRARDRSGCGQAIDLALADAAFALVQNRMTESLADPGIDKATLMARPGAGMFEAQDGQYLTVGALEDHFWLALCETFGASDLLTDPELRTTLQRRAHGKQLRERLAAEFAKRPRDEWIELLRTRDIPCAAVLGLREAADSPYARERHLIASIEHPSLANLRVVRFPPVLRGTPATIRMRPPLLGEHTVDLLRWIGYADEEIAGLRQSGVIAKIDTTDALS